MHHLKLPVEMSWWCQRFNYLHAPP